MKVVKTIKLYMDGKFPRTESGRSFVMYKKNSKDIYARLCQASRKDFRNAVEFAKAAGPAWSNRSAYNRGQILYRAAEMMEGKRSEFQDVLTQGLSLSPSKAKKEVDLAIDSWLYFAGFSDKYVQLCGSINPVSSAHHNFTTPEAVGVITHFDHDTFNLPRLCARLASFIVSGNTCISLLSGECPAVLAPLAETFATSDLPNGVINLLTGERQELSKHVGLHKEVRSICVDVKEPAFFHSLKVAGVDNMKRIVGPRSEILCLESITDFIEYKTAWHPIGI